MLRFVVDTNGVPEQATARIVRSNDAAFGQAVLNSLSRWRYQPATRGGVRVRQVVQEGRAFAAQVVAVRMSPGRIFSRTSDSPPMSQGC